MISSIGNFGRSQCFIVTACCLTKLFVASSMIMMSFAGAEPDWWTESTIHNTTTDVTAVLKQQKTCPTFNNQTIFFDDKMFTIVSEWELVCLKDWVPTVITTTQMVGVLIGAGVVGPLGDYIGRKRTLLLVYMMNLVFTLIIGVSSNWYMLAVAILIMGFSIGGYLAIVDVYMLEFIGTSWRTSIGIISLTAWAVGIMMFGLGIKCIPHWRHLCYANAGFGAPFILMFWFSPERIRWLFIHGRTDEGINLLRQMAKRNKRAEPDLNSMYRVVADEKLHSKKKWATKYAENKSSVKYTYIVLLKLKSTRYKTIIFAYLWMNCSFMYYALTLGVSDLSGDITLNTILMGFGESVCLFSVWIFSKCLGRRYTTILMFICMSLCSYGVTFTYLSNSSKFESVMNILALVSRFFSASAWGSLIIFTTESFPTIVRGSAFSFASVFGCIGGIIAPQNKFLSKISIQLPFTVNGTLALINGLFCLLLTNTHDLPMEDHLEKDEEEP